MTAHELYTICRIQTLLQGPDMTRQTQRIDSDHMVDVITDDNGQYVGEVFNRSGDVVYRTGPYHNEATARETAIAVMRLRGIGC